MVLQHIQYTYSIITEYLYICPRGHPQLLSFTSMIIPVITVTPPPKAIPSFLTANEQLL